MGWTFTHRPKGVSNKDFFKDHFVEGWEILDMAAPSTGELYMAVKNPEGHVFAAALLTRYVQDLLS